MENNKSKQKKKTIIYIIIGLIICIIQSNISAPVSILTGVCLSIPFIISLVTFENSYYGMWFGLIIGMISDAFSSGIIAFNAVYLVIIGYFASQLIDKFFNRNIKSALFLGVISSFLYYSIFLLFFRFSSVETAKYYILHNGLKGFIISSILVIPFYFLLKLINNIFGKEYNKWHKKKKIYD